MNNYQTEVIDLDDIDQIEFELPKARASRDYIDNDKFSEELGKWAARCRERMAIDRTDREPMSNYLGECILLIAKNVSRKHNFVGYSFKDDMISDAVLGCIKYLYNFNPDAETKSGKVSAFNYVTTLVHNHFGARILEERKEQYLKLKSYELQGGDDVFGNEVDLEGPIENDILTDHKSRIAEYEMFIEARKQKLRDKANKNKKPVVEVVKETPLEGFFE